jgi:transcriptional antiterminator NusG
MGFESLIRKIDRHKRIAQLEIDMFGDKRTITVGLEIISKQ